MPSIMSTNFEPQNGTSKLGSNIGSSIMNGERPRSTHTRSIGDGSFGGNSAWRTNSIWGNNNLKTAFGDSPTERMSREKSLEGQMPGSGSLLESSEADGWTNRPNIILSASRDSGRTSSREGTDTSYFALPMSSAAGHTPTGSSHQSYLNATTTESYSSAGLDNLGGFRNADAGQRPLGSIPFHNTGVSPGFQTKPAMFGPGRDGASSGEIMGSVGSFTSFRHPKSESNSPAMSRAAGVANPYSQTTRGSVSVIPQRPSHSAHPSFHSEKQMLEERLSSSGGDLTTGLHQLELNDGNHYASRPTRASVGYGSNRASDPSTTRSSYQLAAEQGNYPLSSYTADGLAELDFPYADITRIGSGVLVNGDLPQELVSQYYMAENPPVVLPQPAVAARGRSSAALNDRQGVLLDHRLRGLQPYQGPYPPHMSLNPLRFAAPFNSPYPGTYSALAIPNGVYSVPQFVGPTAPTVLQRPPPRESDLSHAVSSPLLEEFRNNSKGNKRYELKDIYNHVVEFSGDQLGSRFIQQKLETANSDEKEQVFREIQPNALQLMTDVFGNYVVQKLFEHGNQAQKKILANQMKGRVVPLSLQMYGCRVVQKALDHILMDQQATIVKELENDVMRCVWDQNGNHVIQKAIEMVPPEYVRFIVNAFKGQVKQSAIHPYGCRVVQRMLEHCQQNDREFILNELHANTSTLIPDVYGNYVIQHVIENGEYEDRNRIISVVMSSVLRFSKHKYASNVVEKSIEFGNEIQKQDIIRTLTSLSEKGEDPLLDLIPDQYANYVIQTVLNELYKLDKAEWNLLVQRLQPMLPQLKKSGSSKQIASIENVILKLNPALAHPPTSNANSSTTPPASHKSSPLPSRRSFNDRLPEVGAAPPTPPPTETQSPHTGSAHAGSPDGAEELW